MASTRRRGFWTFVVETAIRFDEDRGFQTAGSLAFTTLLAIVPVITVALALATAYPLFDEMVEAARRLAVGHFLPEAGGVESLTMQLASFRSNAARLTFIGLAFLAVTAVLLMLTVDEVFNRIFRVARPRTLFRRVGMNLILLMLGPVLIGGSLTMTSFLVGYSLGLVDDVDDLTQAVLRAIPFLFSIVALSLLYSLVPNRRVQPRHAVVGALLAGTAFEIAKRGFGWYIVQFPTYTMIYGAFAVLPIFLLWVYVSWVVVLAGATVTAMLGEGITPT